MFNQLILYEILFVLGAGKGEGWIKISLCVGWGMGV
jgi:hypothetical protein